MYVAEFEKRGVSFWTILLGGIFFASVFYGLDIISKRISGLFSRVLFRPLTLQEVFELTEYISYVGLPYSSEREILMIIP